MKKILEKRFWAIPAVLTVLVLVGFMFFADNTANERENIETREPHTTPSVAQIYPPYIEEMKPMPINGRVSESGWVVYSNDKYGFQIEIPEKSLLYQENFNNGMSFYTRIQNFHPKDEPKTNPLLIGEYYLEVYIYDAKLNQKADVPCTELFETYEIVELNAEPGLRGIRSTGGESAKNVHALCFEKNQVRYSLSVGEDIELYSERILDSFKFVE